MTRLMLLLVAVCLCCGCGEASKSEHTKKNNTLNGLWTRWYDGGQKLAECRFKSGKPFGMYVEWYSNGKKKLEATYEDGNLAGKKTWWNREGQVVSEPPHPEDESFEERVAQAEEVPEGQVQNRDGLLYVKGTYLPYTGWAKHKISIHEADGSVSQGMWTWRLEHGKKVGPITTWTISGQKLEEEWGKDTETPGLHIKWHPNGQKKSEATYKDSKLVGKETQWDENGELISE